MIKIANLHLDSGEKKSYVNVKNEICMVVDVFMVLENMTVILSLNAM